MRWPAVVLIPALLAGMWLLDDDDPPPVDQQPDSQVLGPLVASDESLGAFWFCAGGTGAADGVADHTVVAVNTTDQERALTITVYGSRPEGGERPEPVIEQTTLAPYGRISQHLGDLVATAYVSATVEVDGGGVLVEHSVLGPGGAGFDRGPCSSAASGTWTVPMGATNTSDPTATTRELLVFFNPYPADAVLDVGFSTDQGERLPEAFNGFVVPGRSVAGVDLAAANVTVSAQVAAEVVTRTGRVVVDRIQIYNAPADPEAPRVGLALSSGVAEPAESWTFAVGGQSTTQREQLFVYNPSDTPAEVDVEIRPDASGAELATEPFELTVQPHRHVLLDLAKEERMAELLAASTPYSLVVRSADGTPITAERMRWSTPGLAGSGISTSTGAALAGKRLVADMSGAEAGSTLVLVNPSTETIARVRLSIVDIAGGTATTGVGRRHDPVGSATVDLPPGARLAIPAERLGTGTYTVIAESDVPIVGERDVVIGTERFTAIAVPDAATAVIAQPSLFGDDLSG